MTNMTRQLSNSVCVDDRIINRENCEHCVLRKSMGMLFSDLDIEKLSTWLWPIHNKICVAKTNLYMQGQPANNIFSLRRGFVKITQCNEDGSEYIVRLLGPGSCVGLEALLQDHYDHRVEAITEIDFCAIPIKTISLIEQEQPKLHEGLLKQWQLHLHQADEWLAKLLHGPIKKRLCYLLLMLNDMQRLPADKIFLLTNQDIASMLAATEESISRCLSDLRNKQVISRLEKRYYQLDIEGIQKQLQ